MGKSKTRKKKRKPQPVVEQPSVKLSTRIGAVVAIAIVFALVASLMFLGSAGM